MAISPSRHRIDRSLTFDRSATLPETRRIERAGVDPVPPSKPQTEPIRREPYVADERLERVVNLAIALGRPLLLQGDAGVGKTRLAYAVAYALGLPLEEAYIKSTSRAQDLLYTYDVVARLYDSQMERSGKRSKTTGGKRQDPSRIDDYIRYGALGRAIIRAAHGRRSAVLIDEIDKADLDFPNDLLRELDRLEFEVAEQPGLVYEVPKDWPKLRPIIFVTHNEEKALPAAFLRRCIFYYIDFPTDPAQLDHILTGHRIADAGLRRNAIAVVNRLRARNLLKKPGLSELLDWVGYLEAAGISLDSLDKLPAAEALIKHASDLRQVDEEFASPKETRLGG